MLNKTKIFLKKEIKDFKKSEIKELQEVINYHNNLYYNKQNPIISDKEYDDLLKRLKELEQKFNIIQKTSENIGSEIKESNFAKIKHSRPMISLDNTYNEEELKDFDERVKKNLRDRFLSSQEGQKNIEYIIEFKFDGLGIELVYEDGDLKKAITRGNGIEGEDVTDNIFEIENIPKVIDYRGDLEIRGEVVMPISSFKELNKIRKESGENLFSNPRNAASGSLRVLDTNITKQRKLKFFAYDLGSYDEFIEAKKIDFDYYKLIKSIDDLGFETSSFFEKCSGIEEVINKIDNFGEVKKKIDFEIDGLVVKVNDISLWEKIGKTEHHPRYAIAYKFPAEIITTKLLSVEHSVGRTGTITPVANLEEVNIGGVIVKRATIHNYDEVKNLDIRIGDNIFIKRAGEVIPKIISVIKEERIGNEEIINPPEFCPSCGKEVIKDDEKVRYYCPNSLFCPAQISEKIAYSVGKNAFNIEQFGIKQVELFLKEGIIKNLIDIFDLENKKVVLLDLEGFGEKSVYNLFDSIEKSKNIEISKFLIVLQIPGVGKKTARELSKLFKSKEDLLNFKLSIEELEELKDIGKEIAGNVVSYFNENKEFIANLESKLNINYFLNEFSKGKILEENEFTGKKVCITGSFENYKREDLIKFLEEKGGEFVSSVSKNTDFLIAGEKAGSKLKKANELGVKVLNLEEFLEKVK